ncbi:hypothetical protein C8J57DRAFT_1256809 [Mycena rebaudengoi]|nr:hypothetical protein C8J57DRAFT_1256809 [Mycena rebaudengoi]
MTIWSVISSAPQEASGMPDRQSLKPPRSVSAVSRTIAAQLSLRTRDPVLTAGLTEHLPRVVRRNLAQRLNLRQRYMYTKKIALYAGLLSQHLGEMAGIEINSGVVSEIPELVDV